MEKIKIIIVRLLSGETAELVAGQVFNNSILSNVKMNYYDIHILNLLKMLMK